MDFWQVMQFSAAASVVAAVILGLKLLFHDKLDARWHFWIWLVLLVRMLIPLRLDLIRTPVSLLETVPVVRWLRLAELTVHRAGADRAVKGLFYVYLAGAAACLAHDLTGYLMLRIRIASAKEGTDAALRPGAIGKASKEQCRRVEEIARKYGLRSCQRICVQDTKTPYVCGLWRPALVLTLPLAQRLAEAPCREAESSPARESEGFEADEAVILHELLHRKHRDVLVNFLLHFVRTVNWFNPFLWYVTGVVQNDSEALCDQRVLERLDAGGEAESSCEKEYGLLLIHMAEGRKRNPAGVGTSNLANSFRHMKIRIRRIADFKKVPSGIGFVTLCITLIMSVSGIGYCRGEGKLNPGPFRSERDFAYAMRNAELYEAQSPAEALYLYLEAMRLQNPVYEMAVTPAEQRSETGLPKEWNEIDGSGHAYADFKIYNLRQEENKRAQAAVLALSGQNEAELWELALVRENGWKVFRTAHQKADPQDFEGPSLLQLTGQGQYFRLEKDCWNEGAFYEANTGYGMNGNNVPSGFSFGNGETPKPQLPQALSAESRHDADYLLYIGKEDLSGCTVGVIVLEEGADEELYNRYLLEIAKGRGSGGGSSGEGYYNIEGSMLMDRERIWLGSSKVEPAKWDPAQKPVYRVWIFVDGEPAEEFTVTVS